MSGGAGDRSSLNGVGIWERVNETREIVRWLLLFLRKMFRSCLLSRQWHYHVIISKGHVLLPKTIRSLRAKSREAAGSTSEGASRHVPILPPALAKPTDEASLFVLFGWFFFSVES
jgi:hypothetical protein